MTDHRDHPDHTAPPPPGHPSRTDAPALREADALDAWLDARAMSAREGAPAAPAIPHPVGQNGQMSSSATTTTDAASLRDAASRFHARVAAAEEAQVPPTPVDAIWEQIMATSFPIPTSPPAAERAAAPSSSRPARHPLLQAVGSHPAATAVLVAAVLVAVVLVVRAFDRNAQPPIVDDGPAALVVDGSATPTATSPAASIAVLQLGTPDANGCIIRTLSPSEEAAIANPATVLTPDYAVSGPLNDEAIARDGWTALRSVFGCQASQPTLADNQVSGAGTLSALALNRLGWTPDTRIPLNEQRLATEKALSSQLVEQDPTRYIVDSTDQAITPWLIPNARDQFDGALLPQDFVTFADGRIGAPLKLARPGGAGTTTKDSYISPQTVPYVFFRQEDGIWLVDEQMALCTWKCDEYFAARQGDIDADRAANGMSTPIATPAVSPTVEASPSAAASGTRVWASPAPGTTFTDPWLQPIDPSECATPYTTERYVNEQAALLARHYIACGDAGTPASALATHVFSTDFLERHPGYLDGQYTLTEDDVARAQAISTVVASANPTLTVMGIPGADDQSSRTEGFYEVFLPQQNAIPLDDGPDRFAMPMTLAFTDAARATAAATAIAPGGDTPSTVVVLVFTVQDGSPRIDDTLLACIANCDAFWTQQRAMIGTPQPDEASPSSPATATVDPSAVQPIPASECVVPTAEAGSESLPERRYVPPLKPTDANATAVTSHARAFIACLESTPIPATDQVQEILAPFQTERLRAESDTDGQPPTTEQIEAGKRVSSYLEAQGVTTFTQRAPADVVDPGISDWPATALDGGYYADNTPGWYTVPMPGVLVQFPDGRIGVPTLRMVTNDDLWAYEQGQPYASGSLGVFAHVGDTWLLDETLGLCIGDCDTYWQDVATPYGESQWLHPVQGSECQPVSADTYRDYTRPRDYTILFAPASDGIGVVRQSRARDACMGIGTTPPATPSDGFQTTRHTAEDAVRLSPEQASQAQALSAAYEASGYTVFRRAPEGVDFKDAHLVLNQRIDKDGQSSVITYTPVYLADDAVGLADGRIAIPTTFLIADDASWATAQQQPSQVTTLTIWASIGETWLIDEQLPLCIGNCDAYWQGVTSPQGTPTDPNASIVWPDASPSATAPEAPRAGGDNLRPGTETPPSSPATATPSNDDLAFWLSKPTASERDVPDGAPVTPNRARQYLPWTDAGDATARQVARADRNRAACAARTGLVPAEGLYTGRYVGPASPGSAVDAETLATMQAFSAAIPEQDPAAWVHQGATSTAGFAGTERRYAVLPEHVYRLPDGRYAAIPDTIAEGTTARSLTEDGFLTFPVAIYAQSGGRWLLDEEVTVCLGDCQAFWSGFHVIAGPSGTPGRPATPDIAGVTMSIDRRTLAAA